MCFCHLFMTLKLSPCRYGFIQLEDVEMGRFYCLQKLTENITLIVSAQPVYYKKTVPIVNTKNKKNKKLLMREFNYHLVEGKIYILCDKQVGTLPSSAVAGPTPPGHALINTSVR